MSKSFKTHDEMIQILKERNLAIDDSAIDYLWRENYYCLINGYKGFFLDEMIEEECFRTGTQFSDIVNLFTFDREVRNLFFKHILDIETTMKSVIAYRSSEFYKADQEFYLKPSTYTSKANRAKNVETTIRKLEELKAPGSNSVQHYMKKHGTVPFWVIVKDMSFGALSYFYDLLESMALKDLIAQDFSKLSIVSYGKKKSFKVKSVTQDLRVLTDFRNVCAHNERFYCHECLKINMLPNKRADVSYLAIILRKYLTSDCCESFAEEYADIVNRWLGTPTFPPESMVKLFEAQGFAVEAK
ncbi:MAG: Abi family protein [Coriobacteriia bacterium]|nr:Abi family protein [Coriobacteriia bacterium]